MLRRPLWLIAALALLALVPAGAGAAPRALQGAWIGGYGLGGAGEGLDLRMGATTFGETAPDGRPREVRSVTLRSGIATLRFRNGLTLRGTFAAGRIAGTATRGKRRGRFELRRLQAFPTSPLVGVYRTPAGSSLAVAENDARSLWVTDEATGWIRIAWRTGRDRVSLGSALGVPYPFEPDVRLERDAAGGVAAIARGGVRAARIAERSERAEWRNGDVRLVGRLRLPAGPPPYPAVAFLHGSEAGLRDGYDLGAAFWVARGWAVLTYDKRGGGESSGTAVNNIATDEALHALAGDAAAAAGWLAARPDIDRTRIGLTGYSQAGWTIPLAVDAQPAVRFAIILSGPVTSVGHERVYSDLTGDGVRSVSDAQARAALAASPHFGFDPRPVIARLSIPILWQWGTVDRSVFAPESADELALLRPGHDFTGILYPGGAHSLLLTRSGVSAEVSRTTRYVPGLFSDAAAWLAARGLTA